MMHGRPSPPQQFCPKLLLVAGTSDQDQGPCRDIGQRKLEAGWMDGMGGLDWAGLEGWDGWAWVGWMDGLGAWAVDTANA
jgi:hypothetical protein